MTLGQRLVLAVDRRTDLFGRIETRRADRYEHMFPLREWVRGTKRILDVGIGAGDLTRRLCDYTTGQVVGLDVCDLRRKENLADAPFEFVLGDARSLPFPSESFDCVTLIVMLHHVDDPAQALREATRVLQPGGRLIIVEDLIDERRTLRSLFTLIHDSVVNLEFFDHPHTNRSLSDWHILIRSSFAVQTVELRRIVRKTVFGSLHYGVLRYEKTPIRTVREGEFELVAEPEAVS